MRLLLLAIIALSFTACSLTREMPPSVSYHLSPQTTIVSSSEMGCRERVIRVAMIQSPKWLKSTSIFYSDAHNRRYRYTRARWEETPADQLQQRIEQAVTETALYKGVVPYKSLAKNEWLLEVRLEQMAQQIADDGSADTELKLYAVLIDQYSRDVLAQKQFHYVKTTDVADAENAVRAWSDATSRLESELTQWLEDECREQPLVVSDDK